MNTNCSIIIVSDGKTCETIEYVEKTNDDLVIHNPAGETVILQDYNSVTPSPTPHYDAENVANKKNDLTNPNTTGYTSTLAVYNALLLKADKNVAITGITI